MNLYRTAGYSLTIADQSGCFGSVRFGCVYVCVFFSRYFPGRLSNFQSLLLCFWIRFVVQFLIVGFHFAVVLSVNGFWVVDIRGRKTVTNHHQNTKIVR